MGWRVGGGKGVGGVDRVGRVTGVDRGGNGVGRVERGWQGEGWKRWNGVEGVDRVEGVEGLAGVERGGGVAWWKGVCVGGLIHNSVQTAGVCPSLPCPCLTKCRLAASAACTWVRQGAGEGGALVSTQPSPLIRNWSGGCVKILQSFALSNVGSKSL